jgi:tetratricopeptide (TPR) repeat protein
MTLLKDKAIQAMLHGDWENAVTLNKELIEEDPKDIDSLNRLAYVYSILGKIQNAKATYKNVLKIDPLNQIATRNIKKLTEMKPKEIVKSLSSVKGMRNVFLEETGKTKVISLVNTAQPKITSLLSTGQSVVVTIKRSKIFIQDQCDQYLGVLPDDIGRRLIRLIRGGNTYEACIKSANEHNVCVFIKETKRTLRYRNQPSFLQTDGQSFGLSKKDKVKNYKQIKEDDEDRSFASEEES